jgi:hypothetical protein
MPQGMGGPHVFEIVLDTNDAVDPTTALTVTADYPTP